MCDATAPCCRECWAYAKNYCTLGYSDELAQQLLSADMSVPPRPALEMTLSALDELTASDDTRTSARDNANSVLSQAQQDRYIAGRGTALADPDEEKIVFAGKHMQLGAFRCALREANLDIQSIDEKGLFGPGRVTVKARDLSGSEDLILSFEGSDENGFVYVTLSEITAHGQALPHDTAFDRLLCAAVESIAIDAVGARTACANAGKIEATGNSTQLTASARDAIWNEHDELETSVAWLGTSWRNDLRSLLPNTAALQTVCKSPLSTAAM